MQQKLQCSTRVGCSRSYGVARELDVAKATAGSTTARPRSGHNSKHWGRTHLRLEESSLGTSAFSDTSGLSWPAGPASPSEQVTIQSAIQKEFNSNKKNLLKYKYQLIQI